MKVFTLIIASAFAAQAAVVDFDISPPGTDVDTELSPLNAVPAVTNSMGSGGELGEGIYYDMDAELLILNVGYGAAAGFTNLTGAAVAAHIHGPAPTGSVAGIIVDLAPIHFVAFEGATNGGIIQGAVLLSTNMVEDLLNGLYYINIHTETNRSGEIRGQLIVANMAPEILCSEDSTNELGEVTTTTVSIRDPDGDDVMILWSINGDPQTPVMIPGEDALQGTNIVIEMKYPEGTNVLAFEASDPSGASNSCSTTVVVEDTNMAPEIICPDDTTAECGDPVTSTVMVSDADGDDVIVLWSINGAAQPPVEIPGDAALAGTNIVIEMDYPLGTNVLRFQAMDTNELSSSCSTTIVVEDTTPPVIAQVTANPKELWPPNHKMVRVEVRARVIDECGPTRWGIVRVTSNEPANDIGDGNTEQDWEIIDRDTVKLRAERAGSGDGRVYTIYVKAVDGSGNESRPASVRVVVPHDRGGDDDDDERGVRSRLRW
jgi:hypothetical protein